jgi:hypothetical protein
VTNKLYSINKSCEGHGINHEQQAFKGVFKIQPVANGKGAQLFFSAVGKDGSIFHEESSLIGPGLDGKPCLFVLSNNHPSITPHQLKSEDQTENVHSFIFGFGDVENKNSFREEIRLDLFTDGSVGYNYSWGLPGGEFAVRSGAKMTTI